jgi:RNA-directed DNA polymerase
VDKAQPCAIAKHAVWRAYQKVKANQGAAGVDAESMTDFEGNLQDNLYKMGNRMASGRDFPPPVRAVGIPKRTGGTRILGIPTGGDSIAQLVAKEYLEPLVAPQFPPDSYGDRPGKSALQAVAVTRKRCWRYDWLVEYDIPKLFDSIEHSLMLRAVQHHTDGTWLLLYIERWLKAPMQGKDGNLVERTAGTPQGGVVSPLLANLFLHYVFDKWMVRTCPAHPWARDAEDGVVHCRTEAEARPLLVALDERCKACGLRLHPDKTRIIYGKDEDRRGTYPETRFDVLGYTFRPRRAKNRYGTFFVTFTPGVSNNAAKAMRPTMHDWRLHLKPDKTLEDLSRMFHPVLRGWLHYSGRFYKSAWYPTLRHMHRALVHWVRRKYKRFNRHRRRAEYWLGRVARREPTLFAHWQMGIKPAAG